MENIEVHLKQRYAELKLLRSSLDSMFRDSQRFVRPNSNKFDHTHTYNKEDDSLEVYDDTAVWCNQMFANGLSSNLIPKADRWMYLRVSDKPTEALTDEEVIYLETVTERVLHEFALPDSQFYSTSHECFLDIGAYGTSPVQVSYVDNTVTFKARPLADVFFDTDMHGKVDTVYYRCFKTARQMMQMFPEIENMHGFNKNKSVHNKYELVYTVCPSTDKNAKQGGRYGKERPYVVYYWSPQLKGILSEKGLTYMPFIIPRWSKLADEVYGRGPAFTCLSQIRVLNKMVKEALTSAEYLNFPTLVAEEDSIMLPMKYGSRQIMFHEPGSEKPSPIMAGNQPQYVMEMIRMYRETINRSFFVDQIIREQKKERQSVLEIQDTRGQMLNQLSPLLNRMETEYLEPAIETTFELLRRNKQLPPTPDSLAGATMDVVYTSPSAQSQFATKLTNISAFMRDLAPLAQIKPDILDALNERELFEKYARYRNVSPSVIKSEQDIAQVRQKRAQQEELMTQAKAAPAISGSIKDIAEARQVDPEGIGGVLGI
jgi:hypothetical protein